MIDFDGLVLGPSFDAFAEPVVYQAGGGGPFYTRGVFDERFKEVSFEHDTPVTTTKTLLGLRACELPAVQPCEGELVTVSRRLWQIIEADDDGHGLLKLKLRLVRGRP